MRFSSLVFRRGLAVLQVFALVFTTAVTWAPSASASFTHNDSTGNWNFVPDDLEGFYTAPPLAENIDWDGVDLLEVSAGESAGYFTTVSIPAISLSDWTDLTIEGTGTFDVSLYACDYESGGAIVAPTAIPGATASVVAGVPVDLSAATGLDVFNNHPIDLASTFRQCIMVRVDMDAGEEVDEIDVNWVEEPVYQLGMFGQTTEEVGNTVTYHVSYSVSYSDGQDIIVYTELPNMTNGRLTAFPDGTGGFGPYQDNTSGLDLDYTPSVVAGSISNSGVYTAAATTVSGVAVPANAIYWVLGGVQDGVTGNLKFTLSTENGWEDGIEYRFNPVITGTNGLPTTVTYDNDLSTSATDEPYITTLTSVPAPDITKLVGSPLMYIQASTTSAIQTYRIRPKNLNAGFGVTTIHNPVVTDDLTDIITFLSGSCGYAAPHAQFSAFSPVPDNQVDFLAGTTNTLSWTLSEDLEPGDIGDEISFEIEMGDCNVATTLDNTATLTGEANYGPVTASDTVSFEIRTIPESPAATGSLAHSNGNTAKIYLPEFDMYVYSTWIGSGADQDHYIPGDNQTLSGSNQARLRFDVPSPKVGDIFPEAYGNTAYLHLKAGKSNAIKWDTMYFTKLDENLVLKDVMTMPTNPGTFVDKETKENFMAPQVLLDVISSLDEIPASMRLPDPNDHDVNTVPAYYRQEMVVHYYDGPDAANLMDNVPEFYNDIDLDMWANRASAPNTPMTLGSDWKLFDPFNPPANIADVRWVSIYHPCGVVDKNPNLSEVQLDPSDQCTAQNNIDINPARSLFGQFATMVAVEIKEPVGAVCAADSFQFESRAMAFHETDDLEAPLVRLAAPEFRPGLGGENIGNSHRDWIHVDAQVPDFDGASTVTGPVTETPGENVVYTFTYQNIGASDATSSVMEVTLPQLIVQGAAEYLTWVGATATGGTTVTSVDTTNATTTGQVLVNLGTIAQGATATIEVTANIPAATDLGQDFIMTADITPTADSGCIATASNPLRFETEILPLSHTLQIFKTVDEPLIPTGDDIHYDMRIVNIGDAPTSDTLLVDVIPEHSVFKAAYTDGTDAGNATFGGAPTTFTCDHGCEVYFGRTADFAGEPTPTNPIGPTDVIPALGGSFTLGVETAGEWVQPAGWTAAEVTYVAYLVDDQVNFGPTSAQPLLPAQFVVGDDVTVGLTVTNDHDGPGASTAGSPNSEVIYNSILGISSEYLIQALGNKVHTTIISGELGNQVWIDTEFDGVYNAANDTALPGVTVWLFSDLDTSGTVDTSGVASPDFVGSQLTDAQGQYLFTALPIGPAGSATEYTVVVPDNSVGSPNETVLANLTSVEDEHGNAKNTAGNNHDAKDDAGYIIALDQDEPTNYTGDFGYLGGQLGNQVWIDAEFDGVYNAANDIALPGVTVWLFRDLDTSGTVDTSGTASPDFVGSQVTDAQGQYLFTGLEVGPSGTPIDYTVVVPDDSVGSPNATVLANLLSVEDEHGNAKGTAGNDHDAKDDAGYIIGLDLDTLQDLTGDFGYRTNFARLSGHVFHDQNDNIEGVDDYIREASDLPLENVELILYGIDQSGNYVVPDFTLYPADVQTFIMAELGMVGGEPTVIRASEFTDAANGYYLFDNLDAGVYNVLELQPEGFASTGSNAGNSLPDPNNDGEGSAEFVSGQDVNVIRNTVLGYGEASPNNDFGEILGTIGTHVWFDPQKNGVFGADDRPLEFVTVELYTDIDNDGVVTVGPADLLGTMQTDASGYYLFTGLPVDEDYVVVVPIDQPALVGIEPVYGAVDTEHNGQNSFGYGVTLTQAQRDVTWADFGYIASPTVTTPTGGGSGGSAPSFIATPTTTGTGGGTTPPTTPTVTPTSPTPTTPPTPVSVTPPAPTPYTPIKTPMPYMPIQVAMPDVPVNSGVTAEVSEMPVSGQLDLDDLARTTQLARTGVPQQLEELYGLSKADYVYTDIDETHPFFTPAAMMKVYQVITDDELRPDEFITAEEAQTWFERTTGETVEFAYPVPMIDFAMALQSGFGSQAVTDALAGPLLDPQPLTRADTTKLMFDAVMAHYFGANMGANMTLDIGRDGTRSLAITAMSETQIWLDAVTREIGLYPHLREDGGMTPIIFGHSSRYWADVSQDVYLKPLAQEGGEYTLGDTVTLTLGDDAGTYMITGEQILDETEVAALSALAEGEGTDLIIFTCSLTDLSKRHVYTLTRQ